MEPIGAFPELGWSFFDVGTSVPVDECEFMAQLLGPCSANEQGDDNIGASPIPMFWSGTGADLHNIFDSTNSSSGYCPQVCGGGDSISSLFSIPTEGEGYYYLDESNMVPAISTASAAMNLGVVTNMEMIASADQCHPFEETVMLKEPGAEDTNAQLAVSDPDQTSLSKRKFGTGEGDKRTSTKKKARVSAKVSGRRRSAKSAKAQKDNEEESNAGVSEQSSSSHSSEADSNASRELNGGDGNSSGSTVPAALNRNGKARAGRGSASEPQSLYARKRRERINERLKVLQGLVPNGTKVDISTMLEEAVEYVKFLQVQIKLLSSDDLWMYAPIAYNGMNLGVNLNMIPK